MRYYIDKRRNYERTRFDQKRSRCHRPFEVQIGSKEALSAGNERLMQQFAAHACGEDANQAAVRIVREATGG